MITGLSIVNSRKGNPGLNLFDDLKYKIMLRPQVIFDVGANTGQTCQRLSNNFPNAQIHCFEPIRETFITLNKNWGKKRNVILNQTALGPKNEILEIYLNRPENSVLNSLKLDPENTNVRKKEKIILETGDSYCQRTNTEHIDLLKIDTEGYEIEVLEGFSEFLQKKKIQVIYEEVGFSRNNKRNTNLGDLINYLEHKNFLFFSLYELCNKNISKGIHFGNALFIHQSLFHKLSS